MVGHTNLDLKPLTWSQTIGHYPNSDPSKRIEGSGLSLIARATPACDLILRNRARLRDFDITLHVISGTLEPDEHLKYVLQDDAIGGLWFVDDQDIDFVHGWLFFSLNNYGAIWDQVRQGGYVDCTISLGVKPVRDDVWSGNPLSIVSASFKFDRKPIADKSAGPKVFRRSIFARR